MREGMTLFLEGVGRVSGLDPGRLPGETPGLVARTWSEELLAGYRQDPSTILKPLRSRSSRDLVAVRDIVFSSICMHHLLPFQGRAHIAYAPDGRIAGLSSLGRLVDCLSRRLQLQETLTRQIAESLQEHLRPRGAAVVIEASHACVTTRGARKPTSRIVTTALTGELEKKAALRQETLAVLGFGVGRRGGGALPDRRARRTRP